jgi:hypothetical protein
MLQLPADKGEALWPAGLWPSGRGNCFAVHLNRNERRAMVAHFVSNLRNCVHVRRDLSVLRGLGELPLIGCRRERDVVVRADGRVLGGRFCIWLEPTYTGWMYCHWNLPGVQ